MIINHNKLTAEQSEAIRQAVQTLVDHDVIQLRATGGIDAGCEWYAELAIAVGRDSSVRRGWGSAPALLAGVKLLYA